MVTGHHYAIVQTLQLGVFIVPSEKVEIEVKIHMVAQHISEARLDSETECLQFDVKRCIGFMEVG